MTYQWTPWFIEPQVWVQGDRSFPAGYSLYTIHTMLDGTTMRVSIADHLSQALANRMLDEHDACKNVVNISALPHLLEAIREPPHQDLPGWALKVGNAAKACNTP